MSNEEVKKLVKFMVYNAEQESGLLYPGPRRHIIGVVNVFDFLRDNLDVSHEMLVSLSQQYADQKDIGVPEDDAIGKFA